jgi:hypothetical protein
MSSWFFGSERGSQQAPSPFLLVAEELEFAENKRHRQQDGIVNGEQAKNEQDEVLP